MFFIYNINSSTRVSLLQYVQANASLSVHVDPSSLFLRPIVSARFFGDGVLSFGAKFQFEGYRLHAVPLIRGALTVGRARVSFTSLHERAQTGVRKHQSSETQIIPRAASHKMNVVNHLIAAAIGIV